MMPSPAMLVCSDDERRPEYIRCDQCNTPVAEIRNGCMIIRSRHHRDQHVTVLPLAVLLDLLRKAA
jgi:uncharacterized protein with PIN domain